MFFSKTCSGVKCLFFLSIFFLVGCENAVEEKNNGWVSEEILTQLVEIKTDLSEIKKQQKEINAKLDTLEASGGKRRAAPKVSSVSLESTPADNAKVAIVEFTDYQCPFCARHTRNTLPELRKNFIAGGTVHYEVRDFPLSFHGKAKGAAIAVNCVPKEHYNAMHDWVFHNPGSLNKVAYIEQAQKLGVDKTGYEKCLDDPAMVKAIDEDIDYGERLGVTGTPKFFVGRIEDGKMVDVTVISGAVAYDRFEREIKRKL